MSEKQRTRRPVDPSDDVLVRSLQRVRADESTIERARRDVTARNIVRRTVDRAARSTTSSSSVRSR